MRRAAIATGVLLLLIVLGVFVLLFGLGADVWRGRLETLATAQLGREVRLGKLHWDIGSRIALRSDGGSIANAPGFEGGALATWRQITFGVAMRPLLGRRIEIDKIEIEGLVLDLQQDAAGQANWSFPPSPAEPAPSQPLALQLGGIELRDGAVRYRDAASGADWKLTNLSLGAVPRGARFDPFRGLDEVAFAAQLQGGPLPEGGAPLALLAPAVDIDLTTQGVRLPSFQARVDTVRLHGSMSYAGGERPVSQGSLTVLTESLREQLGRLRIALPPMQDPTTLGATRLDVDYRWGNGELVAEQFALVLDETRLGGRVSLPRLSPLAVRFALEADTIDLDRYLEPPEIKGKPLVLPVEWLRSLDVVGELRMAQAKAAGAAARQMTLKVE